MLAAPIAFLAAFVPTPTRPNALASSRPALPVLCSPLHPLFTTDDRILERLQPFDVPLVLSPAIGGGAGAIGASLMPTAAKTPLAAATLVAFCALAVTKYRQSVLEAFLRARAERELLGFVDTTIPAWWTLTEVWADALAFSLSLMAILFAHEMGHYLTARRQRELMQSATDEMVWSHLEHVVGIGEARPSGSAVE